MFPVPLNSSKMTWSPWLPVSTRQVAIMVRLPASSVLRADPKIRLGTSRALESMPPESVRPLEACLRERLKARPRRVIESSTTTTCLPASTIRLHRSMHMMEMAMWRSTSWSLLEARIRICSLFQGLSHGVLGAPCSDRRKSVTSSGRSSTRSTITCTSG